MTNGSHSEAPAEESKCVGWAYPPNTEDTEKSCYSDSAVCSFKQLNPKFPNSCFRMTFLLLYLKNKCPFCYNINNGCQSYISLAYSLDCISKMNNQSIKKILLFFCLTLTIFFTANVKSFASDYQYKVLDPKYNPQAEELLNGTLSNVPEVELKEPKKFDFGSFFAIFALVVFPIIIISLAVKTLKEIAEEVPGRENQDTGNITIKAQNDTSAKKEIQKDVQDKKPSYTTQDKKSVVQKQNTTPIQHSAPVNNQVPVNSKMINTVKKDVRAASDTIVRKTQIRPAMPQKPPSQKEKLPQNANISISKYFSSPEQKAKNPMLLNTSLLSKNKGLCLVEYNKKYSLIGYINNEIFMLNQFDSVQTSEIRSRLSESVDSKDRYIVRLGDYKALVEVSDTKMKLLLEL